MVQSNLTAAMHTDVAEVCYGGTLNVKDLSAGVPLNWCAQGVWSCKSRAESIHLLQLRAVRIMLMDGLKSAMVL